MEIEHKTATLNGKHIAYHSLTEFLVQIGKGKGTYTTKYTFYGDLPRAVTYFNAINIGLGYKKRLVGVGMNKPVLARVLS